MRKYLMILFVLLLTQLAIAQKYDPAKSWRVIITLKSGSELKGVIKPYGLIEKYDRGVYARARNFRSKGAGIRLWYVRNSPGYFFIPYSRIEKNRKGRPNISLIEPVFKEKTSVALQAKRKALDIARKERNKKIEEYRRKRKEREQEEEKEAKKRKQKKKEKIVLTPEEEEILEEFPPKDWNEGRYKIIGQKIVRARKRVTRVGKRTINNPLRGTTKKERTFHKKFSVWQSAVKKTALIEKQKKEEEDEKARKAEKEILGENKKPKKEVSKERSEGEKKEVVDEESIAKDSSEKMTISMAIKAILKKKNTATIGKSLIFLKSSGASAFTAVPSLRTLLKNPDNKLKEQAIETIIAIGEPKDYVIRMMSNILESGSDVVVRRKVAREIAKLGSLALKARDAMLLALFDEDAKVRYNILLSLKQLEDAKASADVRKMFKDADLAVRVAAASTQLTLYNKRGVKLQIWWVKPLLKGLTHKDKEVQLIAANTLVTWNNPKTFAWVKRKLPKLSPDIRDILGEIIDLEDKDEDKEEDKEDKEE